MAIVVVRARQTGAKFPNGRSSSKTLLAGIGIRACDLRAYAPLQFALRPREQSPPGH